MRSVRSFYGIAAIMGLLGMAAGAQPGAETALPAAPSAGSAGGTSAPLVLKIAVNDIYCGKTACKCIAEIAKRDYTGLVKSLKNQHGIDLELTYFMEIADLEKAVLKGGHDGAICKPWSIVRHTGRSVADFKRVADLRDPDNSAMMTGVFLTLKDSPVKSLEDLEGKRIAFGQKDSYEKNQSPLAMLAAKRISPAGCLYLSSCGENLDALMSGKVDAAVISSYALTASCAVDFAKPEDFRTLAKTEEMPLTSLLLDMKKVEPENAVRLQKALLALSGGRVPEDLCGDGFVLPASWKPVVTEQTPAP